MLPGRPLGAAPHRRRLRRGHLSRRVHPSPAGARARPATRSCGSSRPASTSPVSTPASTVGSIRRRHGLGDRPVVVCVSRLVARKGQDALIRALPAIQRPGARHRAAARRLRALRARRCAAWRPSTACSADVVFTGAVADDELPAHYAAGDVFAMPCRTRRLGARRRGARHRLPRGVGDRAGRSSPAIPAGRRTPCSPARPATSWTDAIRRPSSAGSVRCWPIRRCGPDWARPGASGSSGTGSGTTLADAAARACSTAEYRRRHGSANSCGDLLGVARPARRCA